MRIVTLEEHVNFADLKNQISSAALAKRGLPSSPESMPATMRAALPKLRDVGAGRLADMDTAGITVQVLSRSGSGADMLEPAEGIPYAKEFNERLAAVVKEHPARFAAFAHLPMTAPEAAADELERTVRDYGFVGGCINGLIEDSFLDHPRFDVVLNRAEKLDVPLYLHPGVPPLAVRKSYYDGFAPHISLMLATGAWGWHYETAVHVMRLAISGTLDRHPRLKFIVGHMGEGLPAMLARSEQAFGSDLGNLERSLTKTITDQVYVTSSGFFTLPPLMVALSTFGIDRIMFSIDYPFSGSEEGRAFLEKIPLATADLEKIAYANADRLLKLKV